VGEGAVAMAARRGGGAEEEAVEPSTRVRERGRERGAAWWASSACCIARGQKGWMAVGLFGRKVEGKIISA
jgi:hypothetical protein